MGRRSRGPGPWIALGAVLLSAAVVGTVLATTGSRDGTASASARSPASVSKAKAPTPAPTVLGVVNLTAEATPFTATLHWEQSAGGAAITTYEILRGGTQIDRIQAPADSYVDRDLTPGHRYWYRVVAEAGDLPSAAMAVSITTKKPPLSEARLKGLFDIAGTVTSSYGYSQIEKEASFGWQFTPTCKTGPCAVKWKQIGPGGFTATLERSGGTYTGSYTGHLGVKCASADVTGTITVTLTVTKAKGDDGEWRVTRVTGTASETNPAQVGCVTSHAEIALTGTLFD